MKYSHEVLHQLNITEVHDYSNMLLMGLMCLHICILLRPAVRTW